MPRGKFTALSASRKKLERSHAGTSTVHPQARGQKEANSHKRSRFRKKIKLRADTYKAETKKTRQRINETKSWFIDKINKRDKPLYKLTKRQRITKLTKSVAKKGT